MDWNQISQVIQDLGKDVSVKFKDTADVLKLRQKANTEKQRIRAAYEEIGRLYFKECEGKEIAPEYQELFDTVAEATIAVEAYKSKIETMRNTKVCPECGMVMDKEAAFCSKCGAKLPEPEVEEPVEADFAEDEECVKAACEGEPEEAEPCEAAEEAEAGCCESGAEPEGCCEKEEESPEE